jgi:hypothetical protein
LPEVKIKTGADRSGGLDMADEQTLGPDFPPDPGGLCGDEGCPVRPLVGGHTPGISVSGPAGGAVCSGPGMEAAGPALVARLAGILGWTPEVTVPDPGGDAWGRHLESLARSEAAADGIGGEEVP